MPDFTEMSEGELLRILSARGLNPGQMESILRMLRSSSFVTHEQVEQRVVELVGDNAQREREDAAGSADNLADIEEAFQKNFTLEGLAALAPKTTALREELGDKDLVGALRNFVSADEDEDIVQTRGDFAQAAGGTFVDPVQPSGVAGGGSAGFGARREVVGKNDLGRIVERAEDGSIWVSGTLVSSSVGFRSLQEALANGGVAALTGVDADDDTTRTFMGKDDSGNRVERSSTGRVWIGGVEVAGDSSDAQNALNEALENGGARAAGGGAGGGAAVRLQSLGTDKDGFAVIFNPATGAVTKGPQVGFAQIDPRETAEEAARQFNREQQLREGGFVRDVLSGGRNFVTAALLTRGGQVRPGQATQADIIRGGLGVSSLSDALGFGGEPTTRASGGGTPAVGSTAAGAESTRAEINAGLAAAGRFVTGPARVASSGLEAPGGSGLDQQGGVGTSFSSLQAEDDSFGGNPLADLGGFAREEAPPAVKSILGGEEVGFLSTPGATPLASPSTLANLTRDEQGALDTTLQLSEQRTFEEFEQESFQRFRPAGTRRAVRA